MKPIEKRDLESFQRHWDTTRREFRADHDDWQVLLSDLLALACEAEAELVGAKSLEENCCYLLISKSINHALATFSLFERGLIIDGSLSARNAIETLLMLDYFVKDRSKNHFDLWANGKQYKPGYIRSKLKALPSVTVRDVIISGDRQHYEDIQFAYDWLCRITHSNMESFRHTSASIGDGSYIIYTGGSLKGQSAFLNAVFAALFRTLLDTLAICMSVYRLSSFDPPRYRDISTRIGEATRKGLDCEQKKKAGRYGEGNK